MTQYNTHLLTYVPFQSCHTALVYLMLRYTLFKKSDVTARSKVCQMPVTLHPIQNRCLLHTKGSTPLTQGWYWEPSWRSKYIALNGPGFQPGSTHALLLCRVQVSVMIQVRNIPIHTLLRLQYWLIKHRLANLEATAKKMPGTLGLLLLLPYHEPIHKENKVIYYKHCTMHINKAVGVLLFPKVVLNLLQQISPTPC